MILSMTGYGKAESQIGNKTMVMELRSLNSKSMDLSVRIPQALRSRELEIRSIIGHNLERGKVDLSISYQSNDPDKGATNTFTPINEEAFEYYYKQLIGLQEKWQMSCDKSSLLATILRMPDVLYTKEAEVEETTEQEWQQIQQSLLSAIDAFTQFRIQEGKALEQMFTEKLDGIAQLLTEIEPYEKNRVEKIRQHLLSNLDKLSDETKQKIDTNRLEQEMIFYLEKLDVTEEKVRLTNHIRYFRETMAGNGEGVGKKLGFIAQEMGREINTLGSKSNQSEMQIIVVKMKDLLEQIKEQVLNVL